MAHIYSLKTLTWAFPYSDPNSKRNLPTKSNTQYATQPVCLLNFLIWSPSGTKSTTLSTSLKVWKTKLISKSSSITLILLDTSLKSEISKFFKVMITQVSIEMSLSIPPLVHTSWGSFKMKWKRKVETQELWTRFKIFSKNLSQSILEHLWKSYGWRTFMNSAKQNLIQHLKIWCRNFSNSKPISKPFKWFITQSETRNWTQLPRLQKQERSFAHHLDIFIQIQRQLCWTQRALSNWRMPLEELLAMPKSWMRLRIHWRSRTIQLPKSQWMISCTMRKLRDTLWHSTNATKLPFSMLILSWKNK